jgi:hypothetical protein
MRTVPRLGLLTALSAFALSAGFAQKLAETKAGSQEIAQSSKDEAAGRGRSLTSDDRLSLIAAALDANVRNAEPDCSHLVHAIYEEAGFTYAYAPSSDLYAGVEGFQRVKKPEPGDLIVWRGHVGIVIKPSQHIFFSVLSSGPGTDDYTTRYWKHRGKPRFYRYVKSSFAAPPSPRLVRTNRVRHQIPPSDTDDRP